MQSLFYRFKKCLVIKAFLIYLKASYTQFRSSETGNILKSSSRYETKMFLVHLTKKILKLWKVKLNVFYQKGPPSSFSPVTSTNVRIGPKNVLTFSYNPFATLA